MTYFAYVLVVLAVFKLAFIETRQYWLEGELCEKAIYADWCMPLVYLIAAVAVIHFIKAFRSW